MIHGDAGWSSKTIRLGFPSLFYFTPSESLNSWDRRCIGIDGSKSALGHSGFVCTYGPGVRCLWRPGELPAENPPKKPIEIESIAKRNSDQELRSWGENELDVTLGASNSSTRVRPVINQLNGVSQLSN